ncbi:MAG TPA: CBS domain-containing protein [Candidatus Binatia bacterium]|nr:CBS domain-containing protein [Candidatus Binatia bacterium]
MLVSMWMTRELILLPPEATISEAAALMARHHIRRLLVARSDGRHHRLVGITSAHDLARAFPPDVNPFSLAARDHHPRERLSAIMTREVRTTSPDTPIEEAARVLRAYKIGALPVVRGGELIGIITESDVFRAFLEMVGVHEAGVRVTFEAAPEEDLAGTVLDLARRHGMQIASVLSMEHDGRHLAVVRLLGTGADAFVEDVWNTGHRVLSVLRAGPAAA